MKETLKELEKHASERLAGILREKERGKPLVEYTSTFIPEELIRAAGANTYPMWRGGEAVASDAVLDYMPRFIHPLARSMAGYMELGRDPVTPRADLLVAAQTDCHIDRISELLEYKGVRMSKVGVPADWMRDEALCYYVKSLRKMLCTVGEITGKSVDSEAALENFRVSNEIGASLRRICALRKKRAPIGFEDYMRLQHLSVTLCDPAYAAEACGRIADELEAAPDCFPAGAPRVVLAGRAVAVGDYTVPRLLDECGCVVAAEILDECARVTEKDLPLEGDPVLGFAKSRYRDKLPIDIFQPSWQKRFGRLEELIRECGAGGVIWYQLAYDEIYDMEYTCVAKWLGERNIPLLKLETDYSYTREQVGVLNASIRAFTRTLSEGGKSAAQV